MKEIRAVQFIAKVAPLLAPVPSAWFIGRSVYWHLLYNWHLPVPQGISLAIAAIAGVAIELLAISSVYLTLSLKRWNSLGHVQKEHGWESAPFGLAVLVTGVYFAVAVYLLVVLEALPELAPYSTVAFPVLAMVGALNLGMFQQHQDRLDRYGLEWTFKARPASEPREQAPKPAPKPAMALSEQDRMLLRLIDETPQASYSALGVSLGKSKSTVGARIKAMKDAGIIAHAEDGSLVVHGTNGHG